MQNWKVSFLEFMTKDHQSQNMFLFGMQKYFPSSKIIYFQTSPHHWKRYLKKLAMLLVLTPACRSLEIALLNVMYQIKRLL